MIVNSFDFNFFFPIGHNPPISDRKGVANALRTNCFSPVDWAFFQNGNSANAFIVIEANTTSNLFLFRSIPLHGLRSTDLSGESSRPSKYACGPCQPKLYHAGSGAKFLEVLGRCERKTDWRIYADFAHGVDRNGQRVVCGRGLRAANHRGCLRSGFHHDRPVFSRFSRGPLFGNTKAIKLHTEMDLRALFLAWIRITHGKVHDVTFLDQLILEPAAFYIMDRDTSICSPLSVHTKHGVFCKPEAKSNLDYIRRSSHSIDLDRITKRSDHFAQGSKTSQLYPDPLRRISFFDIQNHRRLIFLTNNFVLPALTIALLFKRRWKIELFFKWIKQKSSDQGVLRNFRERRENSNLDCQSPYMCWWRSSRRSSESSEHSTKFSKF